MAKTLLKNEIRSLGFEIPEKGGPFVVIRKKYLLELREALEAIISGEEALRNGRTKSFRKFITKEFPAYAKNF